MDYDAPTDAIAAHCGSDTPAKDGNLSASGILYLPANSAVSLMLQNEDSTTLGITHAQLVIGSP